MGAAAPDPQPPAAPASRWFGLAVGALVVLAALLALGVASAEWFSNDDFAFLLHVQRPWSWQDTFLPLERRFWWGWRPLGMETYFYLSYRAFGLDAFPWFAAALAVHFARFPLVWRLARQLGLRGPAPWMAAGLSVLAFPSLTQIYYASVFHYTSAVLLGTLSLTLGLDAARGRRLAAVGSAVAFAAALLCNESALVVAPVLALLVFHAQGLRRPWAALRRAAPHFAIAGAWLLLRFAVIAPKRVPDWYGPWFGWNLLANLWRNPAWVAGGEVRLVALMLGLAGLAVVWWRTRPGNADRRAALGANAVLLSWLLAASALFATLPFAQPRFAMTLEVPAALLVAANLDALWRRLAPAYGTALQLGFLLLLGLAAPLEPMRARMLDPRGDLVRRFVEDAERVHPGPSVRDVRIRYGGEGLASAAQARRFRIETYQGQALKAARPRLGIGRVDWFDAEDGALPPCAHCLTLDLGPDLRVRPTRPAARVPGAAAHSR